MILVKLLIFGLGIVIGRALRRESDRLAGWDEGFRWGSRHGHTLADLQTKRGGEEARG